MARKKYGPISKAVKELCIQLCLMNGSEAEFKDGLRKLIHPMLPSMPLGLHFKNGQ